MAKYGANLPAVLNPVGDTCVRVYIPNHPDYIKLFLRAIRMLEVNRMYARDETNEGAKIVVTQWRNRTITPLIEYLANATGDCGDLDGECITYPPFASFFSYFPQNPYTEPELIPEGYLVPPFYVNGMDNEHTIPTHDIGDVIVALGAINLELGWTVDTSPRIELCVEGYGVIELHLLNIALGGVAILSVDNPVDLGDIISGIIGDGVEIIELNQDLVSLPPETAEEHIIELEIPDDGEHIVYIYFLPTLDDSLVPLRFGGGIREVSLCGNLRPCGMPPPPPPPPLEGVEELKPQFQFTPDCGLEYRLLNQDDEIVQDWTPVEGWTENAALCFAVGGNMATKEDIRDGLYEAINRVARQIVSGRYTDIIVDDEGNVSDPSTGVSDDELPVDDPETPYIDETEAARMGGAMDAATLFENIIEKIDFLYGATNGTPSYTAAQAETIMNQSYGFEPSLLNAAVTNYYSYRTTQPRLLYVKSASFAQYLYCNGVTAQIASRYLIDVIGFTFAKQDAILQFWNALLQSTIDTEFANGTKVPSTTYLEAGCVPSPREIMTVNVFNSNITSQTSWKPNHRLKFTVTGVITDTTNGHKRDFWYYDAAAASPLFVPASMSMQLGTGITKPTINQVPFSATGSYLFTIDTPPSSGVLVLNMAAGGVFTAPFTGSISVTIDDLGEILV